MKDIKEGYVEISIEELRTLYAYRSSLQVAKDALDHVRDKDGGIRLSPKCVDLLYGIMEVDDDKNRKK